MRKTLLAVTAASLLLLSGCSQKNPEIDATQESTPVQVTDVTPSIDTSGVDVQESSSEALARLQSQLETVYFNFDQFGIRSDMQSVVSNDANVLNSQDAASFNVKLEGNCDEWGTDEYNMALGLKRAKSVKDALRAKGVNVDRLTVVTYGENNPVCSEKTKSCWAKNRRVDVKLIP